MIPVQRMLRTLVLRFALAPREALAEIGRRLLPEKPSPLGEEIREIAREAPLILQVETTNVCNARCAFCAYTQLRRKKGVMDLQLFEKIVRDYADMGGGAVSLTPIMGDPLLDPHLFQRIRILQGNPAVNRISLTTNAIALDQYSDADVGFLLGALDCLQLSIGGLDAQTYQQMYGVDQFARVKQAMTRLLALNETVARPTNIAFAFRTTDWKFELRFRRQLDEYRQRGVSISHLWTYANYGGIVEGDNKVGLVVNAGPVEKQRTCAFASVHMAVCWDGSITACGCADAEGRGLTIGQADRDSLGEVWSGAKRAAILGSFARGTLPEVCRRCSAYQPDTLLASPAFQDVKRACPLPVEFYRQFWGA